MKSRCFAGMAGFRTERRLSASPQASARCGIVRSFGPSGRRSCMAFSSAPRTGRSRPRAGNRLIHSSPPSNIPGLLRAALKFVMVRHRLQPLCGLIRTPAERAPMDARPGRRSRAALAAPMRATSCSNCMAGANRDPVPSARNREGVGAEVEVASLAARAGCVQTFSGAGPRAVLPPAAAHRIESGPNRLRDPRQRAASIRLSSSPSAAVGGREARIQIVPQHQCD